MRRRECCIALLALVAVVFAGDAPATTLIYQSQTGTMGAGGQHPMLPSSGASYPISGLSDVDETLVASNEEPPNAYEATAELTTSLGATQLFLEVFTAASIQGCDTFIEPQCFASASANVTIVFDLDEPALIQIQNGVAPWPANNGPLTILTHSSLGFAINVDYFGIEQMGSCGSLDEDQCFALLDAFGPGAILPAGEYELEFLVDAFTPVGTCNVGCNETGGFYQLTVIPEPAPGALLGLGLGALGLTRRRRLRISQAG